MSADDSNAGLTGVDEQRRKLLKLTLGSGVAFATPLMVSFSMDGLSLGGEGAVAQTYVCNQRSSELGNATAKLDGAGNLLVTVSVEDCAGRTFHIEVNADAEVVWGCRNRGGHFPPGLPRNSVEDTISDSITITPDSNSETEITLTLAPPELPDDLGCPPPMETSVQEVTYSNITGTINGRSFSVVPGELSSTF